MYDVWASQVDPGLWIVLPPGGKIPANESQTDWSLLGQCRVSDAFARQIEADGYLSYRNTGPFNAKAVLGKP